MVIDMALDVQKLLQEGRASDALELLSDQLRRGETGELWNDWATVAFACGDVLLAENGYRRALEMEPEHRQAAVNLSLLLLQQGRLSAAIPVVDSVASRLTEEEREALRVLTMKAEGIDPSVADPGPQAVEPTVESEMSGVSVVKVVIVQPPGYIHSEAFAEVAETLVYGLAEMGVDAQLVRNELDPEAMNLVLGWHLLNEAQENALPPHCILYNLEQMDEQNNALVTRLKRLAKRCELWDYSLRNIEILHAAGVATGIHHVPIGTVKQMERITPAAVQDIDVLFYGSVNLRRQKILEELKASGLRVQTLFGVYGAARDAMIARSRVVLNLHYYEANIFEVVRVSYLLANHKAVVAECNSLTEVEAGLEDAACFVPYENLVESCAALVKDQRKRRVFEQRGYERIMARDEGSILRRVLAGEAEVSADRSKEQASIALVVSAWSDEEKLHGLLDSCAGVDEVVLVGKTSEATQEKLRARSTRLVNELGGTAGAEWLLMLDANERLPLGGIEKLREIAARASSEVAGFSLAFDTWLGGTQIMATGWQPQNERHARFFRRGRVHWPEGLAAEPVIDGLLQEIADDELRGVHLKFTDLEHFFAETNRHSSTESVEVVAPSVMKGLSDGLLEMACRYSPEADGAMSLVLSLGILSYKLASQAKACELAGWPEEKLPTRAAMERAIEAFARELMSETRAARPLGKKI